MGDVERIMHSVQKQIGCRDERLFSVRGYVCLNESVTTKKKKEKENIDIKSFVVTILRCNLTFIHKRTIQNKTLEIYLMPNVLK